jgi:hypothetical protein
MVMMRPLLASGCRNRTSGQIIMTAGSGGCGRRIVEVGGVEAGVGGG